MAENNAAKKEEEAPAAPTAERIIVPVEPPKPVLLIAVVALNMVAMGAVAMILWKAHQAEKNKPKIDDVVQGVKEYETEKEQAAEHEDFVGKMVPMETFVVNLAGSHGTKFVRINIELEVENTKVEEEIEKRKPEIRDKFIILLSSKTYDQISTKDGKENLREEIKEAINSFLVKGKIKNIFFTDLVVN